MKLQDIQLRKRQRLSDLENVLVWWGTTTRKLSMKNDPRLAQYKRILKIRTLIYIVFIFGSPAAIATGLAMGSEKAAIALFMANGFLVCIIAIWLRAIDLCPWCNKPFLFDVEPERMMKGSSWMFRRHCTYCGKPDNQ